MWHADLISGFSRPSPDSLPSAARHSYARQQLALVRERWAKGLDSTPDRLATCQGWLELLPWQEVEEAEEVKAALGNSAAEQRERAMALLAKVVQRTGRDLTKVRQGTARVCATCTATVVLCTYGCMLAQRQL